MASRVNWQRQLLTTLTRLDAGFTALTGKFEALTAKVDTLTSEVQGMRGDMRDGFAAVAHVVDRNERESATRINALEARVSRLEDSRST